MGKLKSLFSISVEGVLKEGVEKVNGTSITQAFQQSERKALRKKVQETIREELQKRKKATRDSNIFSWRFTGERGCKERKFGARA